MNVPGSDCATDGHNACCASPPAVQVCPGCSEPGRWVDLASVRPHFPDADNLQPDTSSWSYCPTTRCPVMFDRDAATTVEEPALIAHVGAKGRSKPVPVCFCFSCADHAIHDDLDRHDGTSSINERIKNAVSTGRCSCISLDPAGVCCLPAVRRSIQSWSAGSGGQTGMRRGDPNDTTSS